jgi:predicted dehydrogenase
MGLSIAFRNCAGNPISNKLKFGIVGAGRVAQIYMQAFAHCREAELVAVADSCIEAAQAMAEKMGCRSYRDFRAMIKGCHLDAAIVCTPPASHPEVSIGLLNAGVHVLCEKPFSIYARQARRMVDVARENRVKLTMASKFRFVTDVIAAKNMVSSGILGDLILLENVFASRVDMSKRWNRIPEISGGGVLIDNGTHSIDLMRYFLGPLSEIHVLEGIRTQGLPVEETVVVLARDTAGGIGSIDLSWSIDEPRGSFLNIYGSRGSISIGWKESKYLDYSVGEWVVFGAGYDKLQAFRSQIENFSRAVRGVEPLFLTDEEAVSSVVIMEAAYLALRRSQWIEIAVAEPIKHGNILGTCAAI